MMINYSGYPELDSDIGPSELSDIAEEPEEGLTDDSDDDRMTPKFAYATQLQQKQQQQQQASLRKDSTTSLSRWSSNGGGSEKNLLNNTSTRLVSSSTLGRLIKPI